MPDKPRNRTTEFFEKLLLVAPSLRCRTNPRTSTRFEAALSGPRPIVYQRGPEEDLSMTPTLSAQKLAFEALMFMLLGAVFLAILITLRGSVSYTPTANRLMGLGVGSVSGLVIWTLYRMTRFVITG